MLKRLLFLLMVVAWGFLSLALISSIGRVPDAKPLTATDAWVGVLSLAALMWAAFEAGRLWDEGDDVDPS